MHRRYSVRYAESSMTPSVLDPGKFDLGGFDLGEFDLGESGFGTALAATIHSASAAGMHQVGHLASDRF